MSDSISTAQLYFLSKKLNIKIDVNFSKNVYQDFAVKWVDIILHTVESPASDFVLNVHTNIKSLVGYRDAAKPSNISNISQEIFSKLQGFCFQFFRCWDCKF